MINEVKKHGQSLARVRGRGDRGTKPHLAHAHRESVDKLELNQIFSNLF